MYGPTKEASLARAQSVQVGRRRWKYKRRCASSHFAGWNATIPSREVFAASIVLDGTLELEGACPHIYLHSRARAQFIYMLIPFPCYHYYQRGGGSVRTVHFVRPPRLPQPIACRIRNKHNLFSISELRNSALPQTATIYVSLFSGFPAREHLCARVRVCLSVCAAHCALSVRHLRAAHTSLLATPPILSAHSGRREFGS